jgi:circadian clock protein KaiC
MTDAQSSPRRSNGIEKAPTDISGFDEITHGGLPRGRTSLVCGSPGCGKSLFGVEFLVRGIQRYGEHGVLMTFEESASEVTSNVASLGYDLVQMGERGQLVIDHVRVDRSEIEETGEYDLEGLFIRLGHAVDKVGAKRVVLDTIESLFSGLSNEAILRAELRRLFRWLKERKLTALITAERGEGSLTRQGLEEYVSDCVILLDHRVQDGVATRHLRVVKYRGSSHGTNEYPFLLDESGFSVVPITSTTLDHAVSDERVTSGVPGVDAMLGGQGYYKGTSILISGTAGTGKTTFASHFADAVCRAGARCLVFAFEESPGQIVRNMRSVGLDLERHLKAGLLDVQAARPMLFGLETHLAIMQRRVEEFAPSAVVLDPISNLADAGQHSEVTSMLGRLISLLKARQITTLMTGLTGAGSPRESIEVGLSSLVDTWILLRDIELGGERNRGLYVLKSRGMPHSNQIREFVLGPHGIELKDVYVGPEGVLTGSMRLAQEARESAAAAVRRRDAERARRAALRRKQALKAQIQGLQGELDAAGEELEADQSEATRLEHSLEEDRTRMSISRKAGHADRPPRGSGEPRDGRRKRESRNA